MNRTIWLLLIIVAGAIAGVLYYTSQKTPSWVVPPTAKAPAPKPPPPEPEIRYPIEEKPPEKPLPELNKSDPAVKEALGGLWNDKTIAQFFNVNEFVRRVVATVDNLPRQKVALRLMPVGETIAIIYLAPFAVMLLAIPFLGERVGPVGWIGATLGFAGVLLIVRPGGGLDPLGVTFALINAGLATAYHLLTRLLARSETTVALLYNTAIVGSVFFCLLALGDIGALNMGLVDFALMALLGVLATLGHFLFTAAYREAPASLLAPINYLHLVWAGGLGLLVFGHMPDTVSLAGMALVCVAGAVVAFTVRPRPAV